MVAGGHASDRGDLSGFGPLQSGNQLEPVVNKAAVRVDVLYTLIHRLGVFRVAVFSADTSHGLDVWCASPHWFSPLQLDGLLPGVTDIPWVSLLIYLVVFDFVDYWIHRGQHHFEWWWKLHALRTPFSAANDDVDGQPQPFAG